MNKLYDVLEICLLELENGASLESILARYPDLANDLRPILKASVMARTMAVPAPSPDAVRRGRAKLLQHASEMREAKIAPRKRMIPVFQRLAISFTLAAFFLASGTGLVGASSTALPGENLYPVKRTWEDVRLFFTFNPDYKEFLESEFESERLDEVGELLTEGRHETIQYSGVFMHVNGMTYVSGVPVSVPANLQAPADGVAVTITGRTNAQRFVEIESIELLPEGVAVPVGEPVEVENESDSGSESSSEAGANSNSGSGSEDGAGSVSGNEAQESDTNVSPEANPQFFEMNGTIESISNNILIVNGQTVYLDNAMIDGVLTPGANVEIKGYYAADGRFIVTEVKVKDSGSSSDGSNDNSDSDSTSNDNSDSDASNDDSDSNDDNSDSDDGGDDSNDNTNDD